MWKKILDKITKQKQYRAEIKRLKEKVNELIETSGDPKFVVEKIMDKGLEWYDYQELKPEDKKAYCVEAQTVLKNRILNNEINYLVSDLIKEIAMRSKSFEHVRDLRMTISGAKLILERLADIVPDKESTKSNLLAEI